jgi:hypothetical protein
MLIDFGFIALAGYSFTVTIIRDIWSELLANNSLAKSLFIITFIMFMFVGFGCFGYFFDLYLYYKYGVFLLCLYVFLALGLTSVIVWDVPGFVKSLPVLWSILIWFLTVLAPMEIGSYIKIARNARLKKQGYIPGK